MSLLSPTMVDILLIALTALSGTAVGLLAYLLRRGYSAGAKVLDLEEDPQIVSKLGDVAQMVVSYAEGEARKWLKNLVAQGKTPEQIDAEKMTSEQKKDLAMKALTSIAPAAGLKVDEHAASIAIEAAVEKQRSLRPPSGDGTTYQSIKPPSDVAAMERLNQQFPLEGSK